MMAEGEADKVCIEIYLQYLLYTYILVVIAGVVKSELDMYLSHSRIPQSRGHATLYSSSWTFLSLSGTRRSSSPN